MVNICDIVIGVCEFVCFYVELYKLGVNIQCFDVGGGLGVDYEGICLQLDCLVNYGLNEYVNNIIWVIGDVCEEYGLLYLMVIIEFGCVVIVYYMVLVFNIIGVECNEYMDLIVFVEDVLCVL